MKKILTITSVIVAGAMTMHASPGYGALAIGISLDDCKAQALNNPSTPCCCPTGGTGTGYTCPSGWTLTYPDHMCTRANTTGSDTTGTYTISYGTCAATQTTVELYIMKSKADATASNCECVAN